MKIDLRRLLANGYAKDLLSAVVGKESQFAFKSARVGMNLHNSFSLFINSTTVGKQAVFEWVKRKGADCRSEVVEWLEVEKKGVEIFVSITENGMVEVSFNHLDKGYCSPYPINNIFKLAEILRPFTIGENES